MTRVMSIARNDARALLPLWAGFALLVVAGALVDTHFMREMAFLTYVLGSAALGAHVVGHEYAHRTLPILLAQPVDRRRVFVVKLAVVFVLLVALAAVAYAALFHGELPDWLREHAGGVLPLVVSGALFIAPLMTMISRGTLAGAIFAGGIPGLVVCVTGLVGVARFGIGSDAVQQFQEAAFWPVMATIVALAAVAGWRMFATLEAIDGHGAQIDPSNWFRRARSAASDPAATRRPVLSLISKELHLQQMSFMLAAIHVVVISTVVLLHRFNPSIEIDVLLPLTLMYAAGQALVIGSLASAEERQLGTFEWQALLPMAMRRQWAIKAAVVFVLTLVLCVALPAALIQFLHGGRLRASDVNLALVVVMLGQVGLYVSSASTSGVRALIASAVLAAGLGWLLSWSLGMAARAIRSDAATLVATNTGALQTTTVWIAAAFIAAALLRFGYVNHRTIDAPPARIARQLSWLAALVMVAAAATIFVTTRLG
jgi:hypothetical protein